MQSLFTNNQKSIERKHFEMFKSLCIHADEVKKYKRYDLFGEKMTEKIHAANIDLSIRYRYLSTYDQQRLAAISLQVQRMSEYYRKKEDYEFDNMFDILFIMAQSIPALA